MNKPGYLLTLGLLATLAACDFDETPGEDDDLLDGETAVEEPYEEPTVDAEDAAEARELVSEAVEQARDMKSDASLEGLLSQARGVLLVPTFGRAAAVVGAEGGEGILVAREAGEWGQPVFYDIGSLSFGAQIGAEGGEIAILLMTDEAVNEFRQDGTFALTAEAGLTVIDYSALAEATTLGETGDADVIFWSDTEGAFAGVSLGATGITFDEEESAAYYGQRVTPDQILSGQVTSPEGDVLRLELPIG
jgi:lipid-binding SYLF domain-containing protein